MFRDSRTCLINVNPDINAHPILTTHTNDFTWSASNGILTITWDNSGISSTREYSIDNNMLTIRYLDAAGNVSSTARFTRQ